MPPTKEARILRSTSKLNPPATGLDKSLYVLVMTLWVCVGLTWSTARARLEKRSITDRLAESNGKSGSVLEGIDWWKTGRAKLTSSPGIEATPTPSRLRGQGQALPGTSGVIGGSNEGGGSSTGDVSVATGTVGNMEREGYSGTKDGVVLGDITIEMGDQSKGILRRILRGS